MKHNFYRDEDGDINDFFVDAGIHNGPGCRRCNDAWCQHCHPGRKDEDCPGNEYIFPTQLDIFTGNVVE